MKTKTLATGVALLCAAAVSAQAQELPKWLTDAKAREARLAEPAEVASEDGWLRTKVPGGVTEKVLLQEGSYSISIPLDGGVAVSCEVIRGARDMAGLLAQAGQISFKEIEKVNGTVEVRALEASDAGAVGPYPFMSLQWLFRVNRNGEQRVGSLKQYVAALDEAVVYCTHDDLGYSKTFEAAARTLTTHLRTFGEPAPQAYFREVSVVSLDGARVGVATTRMSKDADGDTRLVNTSAMLVQSAPGQLVSQDVSDVEWVRPDGSLINAVQAKASNGELNESMSLKQHDDERWRATGTISGKQVDVELPAAPSSYLAQARARRQLMAQANPVGTHTEAMTWSSLDLTRLLATRSTVLAAAGADRYAVREELGGVAIEAVLDKQTGTMASARMPLGPRALVFERIFREGDF